MAHTVSCNDTFTVLKRTGQSVTSLTNGSRILANWRGVGVLE